MPTLTGIILTASLAQFTGRIRLSRRGDAAIRAGELQGSGEIVANAATLATPGITLASGVWRLTWWDGPTPNAATLSIPSDATTVTLAEVVTSGDFTTYQAVYDTPEDVRAITVGRTVQLIFLRQDEQDPPNAHVWFVRDASGGADNGVTAIHDLSGARFSRASA